MYIFYIYIFLPLSFSLSFSKHIQFSVLSPQEIVKNAQLAITHRDLFNDNRKPMENGVLDTRLVCFKLQSI